MPFKRPSSGEAMIVTPQYLRCFIGSFHWFKSSKMCPPSNDGRIPELLKQTGCCAEVRCCKPASLMITQVWAPSANTTNLPPFSWHLPQMSRYFSPFSLAYCEELLGKHRPHCAHPAFTYGTVLSDANIQLSRVLKQTCHSNCGCSCLSAKCI